MNEVTPKNNIMKITVILLSVISVGSLGFIAYDKLIKKENPITEENKEDNKVEDNKQEVTSTELDINSDFVKNLVQPLNVFNNTYDMDLDEKVFDINNTENISNMMRLAALNSKKVDLSNGREIPENVWKKDALEVDGTYYNLYVEATELEKNFKKIYGESVKFENKTFAPDECSLTGTYDAKTNRYWGSNACGSPGIFSHYFELYKAEKNNDEIITYWYSYGHTVDLNDEGFETISTNNNGYTISATGDLKTEVNKLKNEGKINTYKVIFKQQSDGNYYIYSGEWQ